MTTETKPATDGTNTPSTDGWTPDPADSTPEPTALIPAFDLKGLKITPANELPPTGLCMVVYGKPGSGKTTLLAEGAADSGKHGAPALMIDAEGGAKAITHRADVHVLKIEKWPEVTQVIRAASGVGFPYKTVIIDNLSELQGLCLRNAIGVNIPDQRDWMRNTQEMLAMVRFARDTAQKADVNFLMVAWDAEVDGEGLTKQNLGFTPALRERLPGIVDIVGHLSVLPNGLRKLTFKPSRTNQAKFRRNKSDAARGIPLDITFGEDNKLMRDLLATLKGGQPFPAAKYTRGGSAEKETTA